MAAQVPYRWRFSTFSLMRRSDRFKTRTAFRRQEEARSWWPGNPPRPDTSVFQITVSEDLDVAYEEAC